MIFSKSFGYAIRGILYVTVHGNDGKKRVQLDEIAETLSIPRYFLGKVMKKVVKQGYLNSTKGHSGGFSTNQRTLDTSLMAIALLVGEFTVVETCVLKFRHCSSVNPCPLHEKVKPIRDQWKGFLATAKIRDLVGPNTAEFLDSIASH